MIRIERVLDVVITRDAGAGIVEQGIGASFRSGMAKHEVSDERGMTGRGELVCSGSDSVETEVSLPNPHR